MSTDVFKELVSQVRVLHRANGAAEMQNTVIQWLLDNKGFYENNRDPLDELVATMQAKHAVMAAE